jgi:hypothetical protein
VNVHYARLLRPDGTFKAADELEAVLREAGVDFSRCGCRCCSGSWD